MIELLLALAIIGVVTPAVFSMIEAGTTEKLKQVAAGQMRQVEAAAKAYTQANYAALVASSTATTATTVTVATLQAGGYLPAGFVNRNPWKQTYAVYVLEPTANKLMTIVLTTGGQGHSASMPKFGNLDIPSTAAQIGATGGYIPTGTVTGQSSSTILGAFGGWQFTLTPTNIPNPGAGHLASLVYFESATATGNWLSRVAVGGQPELNQMSTTLDMNSNSIIMGDADVGGGDGEGVRSINFEDHLTTDIGCAAGDNLGGGLFYNDAQGLFLCRQGQQVLISDSKNAALFKDATVVQHGTSIPKPTCPASAPTAEIYTAPAMVSDNGNGYPLQGVQTWATNMGANWTVNMLIQTREGYVWPNATYGKILVITRCK